MCASKKEEKDFSRLAFSVLEDLIRRRPLITTRPAAGSLCRIIYKTFAMVHRALMVDIMYNMYIFIQRGYIFIFSHITPKNYCEHAR